MTMVPTTFQMLPSPTSLKTLEEHGLINGVQNWDGSNHILQNKELDHLMLP